MDRETRKVIEQQQKMIDKQNKVIELLYRNMMDNGQIGHRNVRSVVETQDAVCEMSATTEESVAVIENAMCEAELMNDERLTAIEDALCELSAILVNE